MPLYPVLNEGPSGDVVSLDDMKKHLRVDHAFEDDKIQAYIDETVQYLDGRDGVLGRALLSQTWELKLASFGQWNGIIPLPPLIEIVHIKYRDSSDVLQTLGTDIYQVIGVGGTQPACVKLAFGQAWPATYSRAEAVVVQFRAGFVDNGGSPVVGYVPGPIIAAIKFLVEDRYRFPGGSIDVRFKANPGVMRNLGSMIVPHFS